MVHQQSEPDSEPPINRSTTMAEMTNGKSEPSDAKIMAVIAGKSILVNEFGKILTFKEPP